MKFIFIDKKSKYYKEAIDLRISLFFSGMDNTNELINDTYENQSQHLVCLNENKVVGTGRLSIRNNQGIISQMAIKKEFQKKGIGSEILSKLLSQCSSLELDKIKLSARKTAVDFYKKFGFQDYGEDYKSKKTGIIHRNMSKQGS
ncbi:GNAT family N-acetyltransferase [Galbibacter sp. EGI 63066]|uniref:GNAT family N-acetyltransferase n=1 Tax=Galbibacter sp. EGI 63066 TaxID=2993559 RepID=UPI002248F73B|nr:GNAT family N-acetyltransferase [Galbibacter sp. EGI 63066]MCX2680130.1 GNAT family N-acetyltransferase [Galbibacter sp. EGI 63066]